MGAGLVAGYGGVEVVDCFVAGGEADFQLSVACDMALGFEAVTDEVLELVGGCGW